MAVGPVQLVVVGFDRPELHGEIIAELRRLRDNDTVRVVDALAMYKKDNGDIEVEHLGDLAADETVPVGSLVGALVGLGLEGDDGLPGDIDPDGEAVADLLDDPDAWEVLENIPAGSAAALVLLEHHWAVPLRDAVARAGGYRIADGFVGPRDLVALGLHTAEEAERFEPVDVPTTAVAR